MRARTRDAARPLTRASPAGVGRVETPRRVVLERGESLARGAERGEGGEKDPSIAFYSAYR
jgi:hypothetical protein